MRILQNERKSFIINYLARKILTIPGIDDEHVHGMFSEFSAVGVHKTFLSLTISLFPLCISVTKIRENSDEHVSPIPVTTRTTTFSSNSIYHHY